MADSISTLIVVIAISGVVFLLVLIWLIPVGLWIAALAAGVRLRIFGDLVGMRLRKVSPVVVVNALISSTKAGISLKVADLEAHYLARGNVERVVNALIAADKAADAPYK